MTYEEAIEYFEYNPHGFLVWKKSSKYHNKIGKRAGSIYNTGRTYVKFKSKRYLEYKLIWFIFHNKWPDFIDHINRNKNDNRIENLRPCTNSENQANSKLNAKNISGYRGITWAAKYKKWRSKITYKGESIDLGSSSCICELIEKWNLKAQELFGEFAFQNKKLHQKCSGCI